MSPHFKNPTNIQWRGKISALRTHLTILQDATESCTKDQSFKDHVISLIAVYLAFIDAILAAGTFEVESFLTFTAAAFEKIRVNMASATAAQAAAILPAMLKWKAMLGPEEWSKVYVMIPTVWYASLTLATSCIRTSYMHFNLPSR